MDTNPYANTGQAQPTNQTPQIPNTTAPGAVANMIKAIMDGNDAYKQRQQQQMGQQSMKPPGPPMSLAPPQDPTNPSGTGTSQPVGFAPSSGASAPPAGGFASMPQQGLMSMLPGGMGGAASMLPGGMGGATTGMAPTGSSTNAFAGGASPISMDPVTQALMSPIPGM